jgi:Holliday junction resolvase|tara:strand:+ start:35 stop:337 length:303 start_codon:yes stop_codon:yes gene_type:complete
VTPEAKVKKKVVAVLKNHGAYYFYPVTGGYGRSGVPDIVGCYRGVFFGIECKAGRNKPTPLQQQNLDDISKQGGLALVINESNVEEVQMYLVRIQFGAKW